MFGLGTTELVILSVVVIGVFGAKRLPMLGKGLGQGIRDFRKALRDGDDDDKTDVPAPKDRQD